MFGLFKLPTPEEQLVDIQARIAAIEEVGSLIGKMSIKNLSDLENLYYQRNKIKATVK